MGQWFEYNLTQLRDYVEQLPMYSATDQSNYDENWNTEFNPRDCDRYSGNFYTGAKESYKFFSDIVDSRKPYKIPSYGYPKHSCVNQVVLGIVDHIADYFLENENTTQNKFVILSSRNWSNKLNSALVNCATNGHFSTCDFVVRVLLPTNKKNLYKKTESGYTARVTVFELKYILKLLSERSSNETYMKIYKDADLPYDILFIGNRTFKNRSPNMPDYKGSRIEPDSKYSDSTYSDSKYSDSKNSDSKYSDKKGGGYPDKNDPIEVEYEADSKDGVYNRTSSFVTRLLPKVIVNNKNKVSKKYKKKRSLRHKVRNPSFRKKRKNYKKTTKNTSNFIRLPRVTSL